MDFCARKLAGARGMLVFCAVVPVLGWASVPLPDNTVYGEVQLEGSPVGAGFHGVMVEARQMSAGTPGALVATCTLGEVPRAGVHQFVIRVRVDGEGAGRAGALRVGDEFALFIEGVAVSPTMTVGGLGTASALFREVNLETAELQPTEDDIADHLVGGELLTGGAMATADVNGDGVLDSADIIALRLQRGE